MEKGEKIFNGVKWNGIVMLILNILVCIASIVLTIVSIKMGSFMLITTFVVLFIISLFVFAGFVLVEPNEAAVLLFFGKYRGTLKENGYFWINPFYTKEKLTLRARNLDAEPIKVNDKTGNPIMIGMVVVWRVVDTYKASFDVDNTSMMPTATTVGAKASVTVKMKAYENFVQIQSEAALRHVAGLFAYDQMSSDSEETVTLRSSGDEISTILEQQINERLALAGIEILEARLNYIAYAPEIASVMLRRQQADAIIAAREKIVEGAVSMVEMALNKLSENDIVELDNDKKAAMVSNLMVVLTSENSVQPVVNSGTLHQ